MKRTAIDLFLVCACLFSLDVCGEATIEPVSPAGGETVELLPEAQRIVMSFETREERLSALRDGVDGVQIAKKPRWRVSNPLVLRWRTKNGEKGPWRIALGKDSGLADASVWYVANANARKGAEGEGTVWEWAVPRHNLELGRTFFWKVWSNVRCDGNGHAHGSTFAGPCPFCGKRVKVGESPVAAFRTELSPPRWIALESKVGNIRDIGGWAGGGGRRVRQGMVFRGECLHGDSVNGDRPGRNRLTVEDAAYLRDGLGIRTELDLRSERETGGTVQSPIGEGVRYVNIPTAMYGGIFADGAEADSFGSRGKKAIAELFRYFCDRQNYPIYFHCQGGADRTGALAYVLGGVLGVSKHDLDVDWEQTFYPTLPEMEKGGNWRSLAGFDNGFAKYGDDDTPLHERVRSFLLDCGITDKEISAFRSIMLELGAVATAGANAKDKRGVERKSRR